MKKLVQKMLSLFLATILCMGLCTDLAVRAEESNLMTEEQSESAEADQTDDVLTEAGQPDISEAEKEQGESETDKVEVSEQEADEPDPALEESDTMEEQEQSDAFESEEEPQTEPEETEELEQSEERKQMESGGAAQGLKPPWIEKLSKEESKWIKSGQKVTYDCVYFGSYPQSEVLEKSEPVLYQKLAGRTDEEWKGNEITIDGNHYRRINRNNASDYYETNDPADAEANKFYVWGNNPEAYHYFKYEPIKWRVLSVDGTQALLLSDVALDCQSYSSPKTRTVINWDSELRNWLNGWGDYEEKNFINDAFTTEDQRNAIVEQQSVTDTDEKVEKIFLLSSDEVSGSGAETKKYGFVKQPENDPNAENEMYKIDEARLCMSSNYAFAKGAKIDPYEFDFNKNYPESRNCYWWLCSSYVDGCHEYVSSVGIVYTDGDWADSGYYGIRPALRVNLSAVAALPSGQWKKAGTVCTNGVVKQEGEDSGNEPQKPSTGDSGNQKPSTGTKKTVKVSKITLSGISHKIAAGKKIKLTAKVSPSKASKKSLTWKSSNKKVATVNSKGVVTLKKNSGGKTVTITATAKDGSKKKATYRITSMKGVVKKVSITGKSTRTVRAGKSVSLKAKVTASNSKKANKKLKWTISNKKYATVSSTGKVKTKKAGKRKKVKVTAMATDGSGKKKTVTIKIR